MKPRQCRAKDEGKKMSKTLQVLVVEDSEDDTDLLLRELRRGGYDLTYERLESAEIMQAALVEQAWDIVISDYSMPHFNGLEALALVQESGLDLPFIIVSGTIGEDRAVAAMKAGAHDYLMKGQLARLVPAIERELREAQVRREQRQAEAELERLRRERERQSKVQINGLNDRINAIFKTASEVILLVMPDGRIEIANPAVTRKFGYSPDELILQPIFVLVMPSHREKLNNWLQQVVASGQSQQQQFLGLYKDGTTFDMEISLARVSDNDNHIVCILHDISHFKAVERLKDNFISMVSHELRSPITSLSLIAGTLERFYDRYTDTQIKQKLTELTNQSEVLIKLIEGILDISRLETQAEQPKTIEPVNIAATLTTVVTELQVNASEKKQTVTMSLNDEAITLSGNHLDFARIWRNLISNAIKYTHDGGRIAVRLAQLTATDLGGSDLADKKALLERLEDGRQYIIGQVEDTGHGINPADMPTLFQRFNRGWAQASNIPGTGLGLALVRELLALYKGDIHASSQLGQGSIFTFWIPVA
jgi:PAS domain S-box-containing protein